MTNLMLLTRAANPNSTNYTNADVFLVATHGTLPQAGTQQIALDAVPVQLSGANLVAARSSVGTPPPFSTEKAPQSPPPPILNKVTIIIDVKVAVIKPEGIDVGGGGFIFSLDYPNNTMPTKVDDPVIQKLKTALANYTYGDARFHLFNVTDANAPANLKGRTIAIPTDLTTTATDHFAPTAQAAPGK